MTPTSLTPIAVTAGTATTIDPITFEVIRHKLQAITEEQAITLKRVSGSPVVTEATDFNNGLYLADGSIVTMGTQVIFHTGTMSTVIRAIVIGASVGMSSSTCPNRASTATPVWVRGSQVPCAITVPTKPPRSGR